MQNITLCTTSHSQHHIKKGVGKVKEHNQNQFMQQSNIAILYDMHSQKRNIHTYKTCLLYKKCCWLKVGVISCSFFALWSRLAVAQASIRRISTQSTVPPSCTCVCVLLVCAYCKYRYIAAHCTAYANIRRILVSVAHSRSFGNIPMPARMCGENKTENKIYALSPPSAMRTFLGAHKCSKNYT